MNTTPITNPAPKAVDVDDVRARVLDIVVREGMIDRDKITPTSTLEELGVQSIDVVIILNEIEDEFKIYVPIDQTMTDVRNIDDLVNAIVKLIENPVEQKPAAEAAMAGDKAKSEPNS